MENEFLNLNAESVDSCVQNIYSRGIIAIIVLLFDPALSIVKPCELNACSMKEVGYVTKVGHDR